MTGPAVDSAARPVDGPVDVPAADPRLPGGAASRCWRAAPTWSWPACWPTRCGAATACPPATAGPCCRCPATSPATTPFRCWPGSCGGSATGRPSPASPLTADAPEATPAGWLTRCATSEPGPAGKWRSSGRGGHYAKALATEHPGDVSQVVCLGSGLESALDTFAVTRLTVATSRRCWPRPVRRGASSAASPASATASSPPATGGPTPGGRGSPRSTPAATAWCGGSRASPTTRPAWRCREATSGWRSTGTPTGRWPRPSPPRPIGGGEHHCLTVPSGSVPGSDLLDGTTCSPAPA